MITKDNTIDQSAINSLTFLQNLLGDYHPRDVAVRL